MRRSAAGSRVALADIVEVVPHCFPGLFVCIGDRSKVFFLLFCRFEVLLFCCAAIV